MIERKNNCLNQEEHNPYGEMNLSYFILHNRFYFQTFKKDDTRYFFLFDSHVDARKTSQKYLNFDNIFLEIMRRLFDSFCINRQIECIC